MRLNVVAGRLTIHLQLGAKFVVLLNPQLKPQPDPVNPAV